MVHGHDLSGRRLHQELYSLVEGWINFYVLRKSFSFKVVFPNSKLVDIPTSSCYERKLLFSFLLRVSSNKFGISLDCNNRRNTFLRARMSLDFLFKRVLVCLEVEFPLFDKSFLSADQEIEIINLEKEIWLPFGFQVESDVFLSWFQVNYGNYHVLLVVRANYDNCGRGE